jgi:DNA-binding MarR family transcriptional regulator
VAGRNRERTLHDLLCLLDSVTHEIEVAAREVGLTVPQAMLLRALDRPMRMGDLASERVCDPSSLTTMALRLETAGLVRRVPDPTDRRARLIVLTPDGKRARRRFLVLLLREDGIVDRWAGGIPS